MELSLLRAKLVVSLLTGLLLFTSALLHGEVNRLEVTERETLLHPDVSFSYELIRGVVHFTLDPSDSVNEMITDLAYAPRNSAGLVEYSADFKLLIPSQDIANGGLLYMVNNRGRGATAPEISLKDPLAGLGFTYLLTGWINEITPGDGLLRLRAPIVSSVTGPITGDVRYEVIVSRQSNDVNIAGGGHLAYEPTEEGLEEAVLSQRLYQTDPRVPIERAGFDLEIDSEPDSNQPLVTLSLQGGFKPGYIYELIYEAMNPVLAGAGMAGIRDLVSLIRYEGKGSGVLEELNLPNINHTVAYGFSQSGRLLRQYL